MKTNRERAWVVELMLMAVPVDLIENVVIDVDADNKLEYNLYALLAGIRYKRVRYSGVSLYLTVVMARTRSNRQQGGK